MLGALLHDAKNVTQKYVTQLQPRNVIVLTIVTIIIQKNLKVEDITTKVTYICTYFISYIKFKI